MDIVSVHSCGAGSLSKLAIAVVLSCAAITSASAAAVVYDFESLADGQSLSVQIPGLTFANTVALEAGFSLNEFEFPPRSGSHVVSDDGGAITIEFASPIVSVGAFFTYTAALTLAAYDAGNNLLGSGTSLFVANLAASGDPGSSPNERLSFADSSGRIARVVITGHVQGGSFTMDDLTVDRGHTVPEPSTVALGLGLMGLGSLPCGWLRRRRRPG